MPSRRGANPSGQNCHSVPAPKRGPRSNRLQQLVSNSPKSYAVTYNETITPTRSLSMTVPFPATSAPLTRGPDSPILWGCCRGGSAHYPKTRRHWIIPYRMLIRLNIFILTEVPSVTTGLISQSLPATFTRINPVKDCGTIPYSLRRIVRLEEPRLSLHLLGNLMSE
jgi:hypothetical protein